MTLGNQRLITAAWIVGSLLLTAFILVALLVFYYRPTIEWAR